MICPRCHQTIAHERLGVRLTPLKALIVDMIKLAGEIGISSRELHCDLYRGYFRHRDRQAVKAHIWQINDLLEETDFVIAATGRGPNARWRLTKRRM